jgi:DNA-binding MarR family transcriptional regulator
MARTTSPLRKLPPSDEIGPGFESHVPGIDYGVLDNLVGYAVRRSQILIYEDFLEALAPWEITPARFSALVLIARNPGMKQTDLAHLLGIARSGVVMLTDGLEELGYVRRVPSKVDRRAYMLELTPAGSKALAAIERAVLEHDARVSSRLSDAEKSKLMQLLAKLGPDGEQE